MTKDNRVSIEVDLTDDEWYTLMKLAHEQDITLNQLVENILKTFIENYPESEFKKIALQKVEIGLAEKAIKSKSAGLLNEFLLQFPNSNFKETIIQ